MEGGREEGKIPGKRLWKVKDLCDMKRIQSIEKGFKGTSWGDRNALHLVWGGGFMDIYEYQNLKICAFLHITYIYISIKIILRWILVC